MYNKIFNSTGLFLDIIGACFVAWEVFNKFKGTEYIGNPISYGGNTKPLKTKDFKKWEFKKYKKMFIGLLLLTVGFILQIISNWL